MTICSGCGHQPPAESLFCNMCGLRLQAVHEETKGYTPPHLVEKVLRMRSALEGERKQVTVMFADVKGSVAMSEHLDAEVWHQIMDRFFAIVTSGVHDFEGTINQYTGDGIMALFGAPIAHEDHARRACLAALRIQAELRQWSEELQQEYEVEFLVRIGMNSGEVVVGRIGDDLRMDYTAQGHTVGLAARMESMAKPGRIFISQFTQALVGSQFEVRENSDVRIKGISGRVKVYDLRRMEQYRSRFEVARERGLPPLIGRESELQALNSALEKSLNGQGQVIALTGEPGVGKSRLLYEFGEQCRTKEIKVVSTRGVTYHKAVPAAPLANFIRSYFQLAEGDDAAAAMQKIHGQLKRLSPGLEVHSEKLVEFLGMANVSGAAAGLESQISSLGHIIVQLIDAASRSDSGVVLVDNLHWIDNDVVGHLLDYLVEAVAQSRTLVVVTYRPEYRQRWQSQSHFNELQLRAFDAQGSEDFLTALLGDDESLTSLKQEIHERTAGNPLFMEQVSRMLIDNGQLEKTRHGYQLNQSLDEVEVPAEIQALVAARIDRLPEQDKRILQVASVIGNRFGVRVLQAVSGLTADEISSGLERLTVSAWVYRCSVGETSGQVEYAFHQSLLRDVTYLGQLAENRAKIHREVAADVVEHEAKRVEGYEALVAHHYGQAGDLEMAIHWYARAANWASQRDIRIAMQHWHSVSELVSQLPDSPHSADVALQACSRLIYLGARFGMAQNEMTQLMAQGEKMFLAVEDEGLRCFFLLACATAHTFNADVKQAAASYQRADELAQSGGVGMQAAICMGQAHMYLIMGELWQAESVISTGLTMLDGDEASGSEFLGRSPYVSLLSIKAWLRYSQGRMREASKLAAAARELAIERGEPEHQVLCDIVDALVTGSMGHPRKAITHAKQALEKAEQHQHAVLRVTALWVLGHAYVGAEQAQKALDVLEQAQTLAHNKQVAVHVEQRIQVTMGRACILSGEADVAKACLRDAARQAKRRGLKYVLAEAELAQAELLGQLFKGRRFHTEAFGHLKQVESILDEFGAESLRPRWHMAALLLAELRNDDSRVKAEWRAVEEVLKQWGADARLRRLRAKQSKRAKGKEVR